MNDHSRENREKRGEGAGPWERPELTPEQAKRKKEKIIMIAMIALAVVMVIAAGAVMFYNRWVQKPQLPAPGPTPQPSGPAQPSEAVEDPSAEPTLNFDAVQPKVGGERRSQDI